MVHTFYVGGDGGKKFSEFLGIPLEPQHIHSGFLLGLQQDLFRWQLILRPTWIGVRVREGARTSKETL